MQQFKRGFLPEQDPVRSLSRFPELDVLDEIGHDLPSLLYDPRFRDRVRRWSLPHWPADASGSDDLLELRLYYVRLGFLASAYVNQLGQPRASALPAVVAVPLCDACRRLGRPPILSYDGYALYNWKRFEPAEPVALGNIDTLQNFVHLYDEHWFILVHVEIEAIAADILAAIARAEPALHRGDGDPLDQCLAETADAVWRQVAVLRRIPEHMDPALYYRTFRQYIRFFERVTYEGVVDEPMDYRGETGAQSSIMPTLIALMKIPHRQTALTDHLADMRRFMPPAHRAFIDRVASLPPVRNLASKQLHNEVLEAMATFREVHYGWAQEYINKWVDDPRGTGGTPYMQWLHQLIDETRAAMI